MNEQEVVAGVVTSESVPVSNQKKVGLFGFACWQIGIVSIFLSSIGGNALIAINLRNLGHRILGLMIFLVSPLFMAPMLNGNKNGYWIPPLLTYFLARMLFGWQYAPFRREFARISKPPGKIAPLWFAFLWGAAGWGVLLAIVMGFALLVDLSRPSKISPIDDDVPVMMAPPLQGNSDSHRTERKDR